MHVIRRWTRRLFFALLALLLLTIGVVGGALWLTLPANSGKPALAGLTSPVSITIDDMGIPRITAGSERDAAMALGWLHARDRMFQMELMRRGAAGRLSEIAGPSTLRLDRFTRTLGLARRAEEDLATLAPETRETLEAYAAGVNAYIAEKGRFIAPEFIALGAPEPWKPSDSLLWGKVMGLWLSGDWRMDLERAGLANLLPTDRVAELWPRDTSPGRPDQTSAPVAAPAQRTETPSPVTWKDASNLLGATPVWPVDAPLPPSASNSWAVAPSRALNGAAMLASDPHLGFQAPILWYLARIELPDGRFLAGATSPGVPFIVIGRNESLAWGFTTTHSDTQDIFIERRERAGRYVTPDGPAAFTSRRERIAIRGQPDEWLTVRETRHGPVISDLGEATAPEGNVLAVAMANLAPADTAADGLLGVNRAHSIKEARTAARLITSPPQNLMLADKAGHIAMLLTGRTPIRRAGDGSMPVAGWDGAHDWTGWIPFDNLPHAMDPPGGALANANNRVEPQGSPVFLGRDWFGDWRFRRIHERLAAKQQLAPDDLQAIQNDTKSLLATDLLPYINTLPAQDGTAGLALDLLKKWDGTASPDLPQPLIFNEWWRELARLILTGAGLPDGAVPPRPEFLTFALSPAGRHWCGIGEDACTAPMLTALRNAVTTLQAEQGDRPEAWRWGAAHQVRFDHPLLRSMPLLGRLVGMQAPSPGDNETISRGGMRGGRGTGRFAHVHGAGLRLVADLHDGEGLWAVIATGQSGNPLSAHWDDAFPRWLEGNMLHLGARPETVTATLALVPR